MPITEIELQGSQKHAKLSQEHYEYINFFLLPKRSQEQTIL